MRIYSIFDFYNFKSAIVLFAISSHFRKFVDLQVKNNVDKRGKFLNFFNIFQTFHHADKFLKLFPLLVD